MSIPDLEAKLGPVVLPLVEPMKLTEVEPEACLIGWVFEVLADFPIILLSSVVIFRLAKLDPDKPPFRGHFTCRVKPSSSFDLSHNGVV